MKKLTRDETDHGEYYYLASEVDAQPPLPVQEPVGSVRWGGDEVVWTGEPPESGALLYTAPPQREWVELTPEEIEACRQEGYLHSGLNAPFDFDRAAGAVLAKAKEKNT